MFKDYSRPTGTSSTILLQLKPLETSKFPVVFLFSGSCRNNQPKPAKTGSMKQNLRNIYVKLPPQRWADTDVDPAPFSRYSHVNENVYQICYVAKKDQKEDVPGKTFFYSKAPILPPSNEDISRCFQSLFPNLTIGMTNWYAR